MRSTEDDSLPSGITICVSRILQVWCPIGGPDRLWQMAQYSSARNSLPLFPTSMNAQKEGNLLSVEHGIATFLTETGALVALPGFQNSLFISKGESSEKFLGVG